MRRFPSILLLVSVSACAEYQLPPNLASIVDPNQIVGTLLPPVSGDPNTWDLPVGFHTRTGPARHVAYIDIDYDRSMPRVSNSIFLHETTWDFEMWIVPGLNYKVVRAYADPRYVHQEVQYYTIIVNGVLPPGEKPALE